MDSGAGASGGSRDPARHARFPRGDRAEMLRSLVPAVQTRCSTKCVFPLEAPWLDPAGLEPQLRSWADLPADILGVLTCRLPRLDDRARLRSVCRAWRAAARLHRPPPPPLPLLVLSDFSFASFCADGVVAPGTRCVSLPAGKRVAPARDIRCVGSFEGWLVGVQLNKGRYFGDGRCFLMNAFSRKVICLPPPSMATQFIDAYSKSVPIVNGSGVVHCTVSAAQYVMSFSKVVLSASPDSGSKCVVAAVSVHRSSAKLALWRPGMTSWCVCHGGCISKFSDIALYQGKLYMFSKLTTNLFVFEISEDDSGLMVSHVERCVTQLPEVDSKYGQRWNIVEWRGKLLLVVTYLGSAEGWHNICKIGVFKVDMSTTPFRFIAINSLDGDCMFISPCSSKSFQACQYDEVEDISEDKLRPPGGMLMNPTWLFPSE
ncbi:hypothetical protein QOZ80_9AG0683450 [Eleusine coracana subsp. coracana]|nr:hypothetical protein QOZ80_9AG0683450 [Eleusine coracana subsp. coracana]